MTTLTLARPWTAPAAVALGLVVLATRVPSYSTVLVTAAVGAMAAAVPVADQDDSREGRIPAVWVVMLGAIPFFVAASWMRPSYVYGGLAMAAGVVAAIAEEVFFRRLVYGWLAERGPAVAVAASAALFALVHVPAYGIAVLPIDLAAGLIFGWQRWASGSWQAPALTHSIANVLAAL